MHLHLQEDWGGLEGKTCQEPPCKEVVVVVVLLLSHLLPPSQGPQPLLWYTLVLYCTLVYNTVGEPDYSPTTTHPPRKLGFDGRLFLAFRRCSSHLQFTCPVHPCFKAVLWLLCNSAMVHLFLRCFSILEWTIAQFPSRAFEDISSISCHRKSAYRLGIKTGRTAEENVISGCFLLSSWVQTDSKIAVPLRVLSCPRPLTSHDLSLLEPALSWTQFHIFIS